MSHIPRRSRRLAGLPPAELDEAMNTSRGQDSNLCGTFMGFVVVTGLLVFAFWN